MIAKEAERVQIPLAAQYLSKKRLGYLEYLVHATRLATAIPTPDTQRNLDRMVKTLLPAKLARAGYPYDAATFPQRGGCLLWFRT